MSDAGRIAGHGLRQVDEALCEIPAQACVDMRVPARVFADRELLEQIAGDRSLEQLQNVATLPGIVDAALAMPDIRQGYGFPVGGVAATDPPDGVVSPGGVGYDINCGVRLLALPMSAPELGARREPLVHEIARRVPVGAGHGRGVEALGCGARSRAGAGPSILVAEHGFGVHRTSSAPSRGPPGGSRPRGGVRASVGARGQPARHAGVPGRHFIELQCVARVLDPVAADAFGLRLDQLTC